jgi:hypothetical protein
MRNASWPRLSNRYHVAFIRGRVGFELPAWFVPADEKQKPSVFSGAIVVFDKPWNGPAMSYVSREDLDSMGRMFMSQIKRAAYRLSKVEPHSWAKSL